jgi:hypothetical protein
MDRTARATPRRSVSKPYVVNTTKEGAEPALDRPLPQNLDAERSVLGAILLDNRALNAASEKLKPADFALDQHRRIFGRMIELGEMQQAIDLVTLSDKLHRKGELEAAGGSAYLAQLVDGVPRVTHLDHYAGIVKEKSRLRAIIWATHDARERAFAAEEDADAILGRARLAFGTLADQQEAADIFDTWEEFQNTRPLRALIENCLWADVANVVGGLSGEGKTLILLASTKALLSGQPLFGHFRVIEPLDRVIYLIPECARAPYFHRAKLFGLTPYLESGRLLVRTLSKGPRVDLDDPRLLRQVRDAAVMIDTAARFGEGDENSASDTASGLANDIFGLLSAGASCVPIAHHSPKSFAKDNYISLENVLRGSGDFGAFVGAGFGIRQIDKLQNVIHLESIKARDSEAVEPFQIIGRPWIDQEGDFRMHRNPGECGKLAEYLEDMPGRNRGGAPDSVKEARAANLELLRQWLAKEPHLSSRDLSARFSTAGIKLGDSAIRKYRKELGL